MVLCAAYGCIEVQVSTGLAYLNFRRRKMIIYVEEVRKCPLDVLPLNSDSDSSVDSIDINHWVLLPKFGLFKSGVFIVKKI